MDLITIKPCPEFINILTELSSISECPQNIKKFGKSKKTVLKDLFLNTGDIKWCYKAVKSMGLGYHISLLLDESEIILPEYIPPPRNPVLEARCLKLRKQQENKQYNEMTKNMKTIWQRNLTVKHIFGISYPNTGHLHYKVNKKN